MRAFNEIDSFTYTDKLHERITSEIEGLTKEYILGVDENDYKNYLIEKYTLEPLKIFFDKEKIERPTSSKEWFEDRFYGEKYQRDVYHFSVAYPFTVSPALFKIHPSTWAMTSYDINIDERNFLVSFSLKLTKLEPEEFQRQKDTAKNSAFANVDNANAFARAWNLQLQSVVTNSFSKQKSKYNKENDFFAAINIPFDKDTQSIFTPPIIKKREIPQPLVNKNQEFSSEPIMGNKMYEDILKIIYDAGKSMERKPVLYISKDEEGLRDQFLFILETRYDAITASGETFNRSGKTDIILKYAMDGTNLFVAECKFWHGFKGLLETISQLFDRYLTWRDSKVAVMIFVKNNDFTSVLKNIATETRNHPYYVKDSGHRGESSFSYIFRLPQDSEKHVFLEVMAFHYDK